MKKIYIFKKIKSTVLCSILVIILFIPIKIKEPILVINYEFNNSKNYFVFKPINNDIQYPDEFILDNIITFKQYPKYPTGCEVISLYILLRYYNIDVSIDEIIEKLPKGKKPYLENNVLYGGNPEYEFVGNPLDKHSYGCYNKPIAKTANLFKKGAISEEEVSLEKLKYIIYTKNPIIVWVNTNKKANSIFWKDYTTKEKVNWVMGEHAVILYGYDKDSIYISDPNNGKKYGIETKIFEEGYLIYNKRVVYYK